MTLEVLQLLSTSKRRKEFGDTVVRLEQMALSHSQELLQALKEEACDQEHVSPHFGNLSVKAIIVKALLAHPTPELVLQLRFALVHPDESMRWTYAHLVAAIGEEYCLKYVEECLASEDRSVRAYASYGLRDASKKEWTASFGRQAARLLLGYISIFPNEAGNPRYEALERFDPQKYSELQALLDEGDQVGAVFRAIYTIADSFRSHKDAVMGFNGYPVGYRYFYSLSYIDSDIRNGGISQFHRNTTWHLVLDGIEASREMGYLPLSDSLRHILYYYSRSGRSRLKGRIPNDFFDDLGPDWKRTLDHLERSYYQSFNELGFRDCDNLLESALDSFPDLFAM